MFDRHDTLPAPSDPTGDPPVRGVRARPGFAMFMALGALVIVAALVAGSSFITLQETHLGQNTIVQHKAFAVAEYGLNKIQADWDKTPNLTMAVGDTFNATYVVPGQGTAHVRMTRLNDETFWIVSRGNANLGIAITGARTAVKRVGAVLRLRTPSVTANAAVTSGGSVHVQGSVSINGNDVNPPAWGGACSPPGPGKQAILVPENGTVTTKGSPSISGWAKDPIAGQEETYLVYGDENWPGLAAQANHVFEPSEVTNPIRIEPSVANGTCNRADKLNWGEPTRSGASYKPECINYFPIIHIKGSPGNPTTLKTNGDRAQGILLIDGDLNIHGNWEFHGLIIATGSITNSGGTPKIFGAVMAAANLIDEDYVEGGGDGSSASGNITYQYSSCSLERALRGSALVQQARHRAWAELF